MGRVYTTTERGKVVLVDMATGRKWANEYFKDVPEARDFCTQNNLTLEPVEEAKKWWNDTLSMNEQNALASKHLLSYQAKYITTQIQYVPLRVYNALILEVWKKENVSRET